MQGSVSDLLVRTEGLENDVEGLKITSTSPASDFGDCKTQVFELLSLIVKKQAEVIVAVDISSQQVDNLKIELRGLAKNARNSRKCCKSGRGGSVRQSFGHN